MSIEISNFSVEIRDFGGFVIGVHEKVDTGTDAGEGEERGDDGGDEEGFV